jgi:hypothetical protein
MYLVIEFTKNKQLHISVYQEHNPRSEALFSLR